MSKLPARCASSARISPCLGEDVFRAKDSFAASRSVCACPQRRGAELSYCTSAIFRFNGVPSQSQTLDAQDACLRHEEVLQHQLRYCGAAMLAAACLLVMLKEEPLQWQLW